MAARKPPNGGKSRADEKIGTLSSHASTVLRGYILKNDTTKHTDLLEGFAPLRPRLIYERKSDIIEKKEIGKSKNKPKNKGD